MNTANQMESCMRCSQQGGSRQSDTRNGNHRARLLVVEDDLDISSLLQYTLDNAHFDTIAAPDCKTAWKILIEEPPELVVLDWMLPDTSGIELLQRIRREPALESVPVIMLTARSEESDRVARPGKRCGRLHRQAILATRTLRPHQEPPAHQQQRQCRHSEHQRPGAGPGQLPYQRQRQTD